MDKGSGMKHSQIKRNPVPRRARSKPVRRRRALGELLRDLRVKMPELSTRYGVRSLGVFGSYLRGEQKLRSDLDVLVELEPRRDTFKNWIELQTDLQHALGVKVDLVENKNLKPFIGKRILSEVVWLRLGGKDQSAPLPRRKKGGPRMPDREYLDFMNDILQAMEKAARFVAGVSYDEFIVNDEKIAAVEREIEIIGEAVKNIPAQVRSRYPEIDWKNMAGMRDRLAHGYFSRDLAKLWSAATEYIPEDKERVATALAKELERRAEQKSKKANGEKKNGR